MSRRRTLATALAIAGALVPTYSAQADAARITLGDRNLRQGMAGRDVRVLQDFLTRVGLKTSVDGQYGRMTRRSVRRWESKSTLSRNGRMSRRDEAILRGQVKSGENVMAESGDGGASYRAGADSNVR